MYKTIELLFIFVLQYFFLEISSNVYKLIGSFAIIIGILLIMGFRLVEKNYSLSIENSYLKNIIFYKF
jgi:hypothetical protein